MKRKILIIKCVLCYLIIHSLYYLVKFIPNLNIYFDSYSGYPIQAKLLMLIYLLLLVGCVIFSVIALQLKELGRKGIVGIEIIYIVQYVFGLLWYTNVAYVDPKRVFLDIGVALIFIIFFTNSKIKEVFS